jgi:hypothetical protein
MDENKFSQILKRYLDEHLEGYEVTTKESILYNVIVVEEGKFRPDSPKNPKRGSLTAFETDLLIKTQDGLPLVVCELKCKKKNGGFSTDDILAYSTRALKHKEIYPYLRYGFIAGNTKKLTNKFFTHNAGFDFAMATVKPGQTFLMEFIKIIHTQIKNAQQLLEQLKDNRGTTIFNTCLKVNDTE